MKNWKTSLAGVVVAVVGFAIYQGWITQEIGTAVIGLAVALGFVGSATQMIVITLVGLLAAFFYFPVAQPQMVFHLSYVSWFFFGATLLLLMLLSVWVFRNYTLFCSKTI